MAWILLASCLASCDLGVPETTGGWHIESAPRDGDTGVARQAPLEITLDRRILPRSVTSRSIRLRSSSAIPPAAIRYDLLDRSIRIEPTGGAPLVADTTYELEIDGLIDLDGEAQPEPYRVYFTTGAELGERAPAPARVDPREVLALLHEQCAAAGCHVALQPAAALDLSSVEERPNDRADEHAAGPDSLGGQTADGALWLPATRIVDVTAGRGDPARSYLMYKVLGDAHIAGEIMPPRGRRLSGTKLELLSAWIASGARTGD